MDVSVMQRQKGCRCLCGISLFNANVTAVTASVHLFYSAVISVKDMIAGNDDNWDDEADDAEDEKWAGL